jgi:hypothetical protein
MFVFYKDGVAWLDPTHEPDDNERIVRGAVAAALPDIPEIITINQICEYVKVDQGEFGEWFGGHPPSNYVEYHFNVQGESALPLKESSG